MKKNKKMLARLLTVVFAAQSILSVSFFPTSAYAEDDAPEKETVIVESQEEGSEEEKTEAESLAEALIEESESIEPEFEKEDIVESEEESPVESDSTEAYEERGPDEQDTEPESESAVVEPETEEGVDAEAILLIDAKSLELYQASLRDNSGNGNTRLLAAPLREASSTVTFTKNGTFALPYFGFQEPTVNVTLNTGSETIQRTIYYSNRMAGRFQQMCYYLSYNISHMVPAQWNAYAPDAFKRMANGTIDWSAYQATAYPDMIQSWLNLNNAATQYGGWANIPANVFQSAFVNKTEASARADGQGSLAQWYYLNPRGQYLAVDRLVDTQGNTAYCIQLDYAYPNQMSSTMSETAKNGFTDAQINMARQIIYHGYPTLHDLDPTYQGLSNDAKEFATQMALWAALNGTPGNNGTENAATIQQYMANPDNYDEHPSIWRMDKANPVNNGYAESTAAINFFNYLLRKAQEPWEDPKVGEMLVTGPTPVGEGADRRAQFNIKINTVKVDQLIFDLDVPAGSTISGTAIQNKQYIVDKPSDGEHNYTLSIPDPEGGAKWTSKIQVTGKVSSGLWYYPSAGAGGNAYQDMIDVKYVTNDVTPDVFRIILMKKDQKTGEAIANATYGVYTNSACTTPATDVYGNVVTLTTDANGTATSPEIARGTYYVKETSSPNGYAINPEVTTVDLVDEGGYAIVNVEDPRQSVVLNLEKTSADGASARDSYPNQTDDEAFDKYAEQNLVAKLSGAEFELYSSSELKDIDTGDTIPANTLLFRGTIDDEGKITASKIEIGAYAGHDLPNGIYKWVETKAPKGFALSYEDTTVDARWQANNTNADIKVDGGSVSAYGNVYTPATATPSDEILRQKLSVQKNADIASHGSYALEGIGFELYLVADILDANGLDSIEDLPWDTSSVMQHGFYGLKYDEIKELVANVNPAVDSNGDYHWVTDAYGEFETGYFVYGDYILFESEPDIRFHHDNSIYIQLPWVRAGAGRYEHDIDYQPTGNYATYHQDVMNFEGKAYLYLTKVDSETEEAIEQEVPFEIYDNEGNLVTKTIGALLWKQTFGDPWMTNEEGWFTTAEAGLQLSFTKSDFTIKELKAPAGYAKGGDITLHMDTEGAWAEQDGEELKCNVEIDDNGDWWIFLDVPNDPVKVAFTKYETVKENGREKNEELGGAVIALYEKKDGVVSEEIAKNAYGEELRWETEKDLNWTCEESGLKGHMFSFVIPGTYVVREIVTPPGYVTAEDREIVVEEIGGVQHEEATHEIFDDITKVLLSKTDMVTGFDIPGAELVIKDSEGNEVYSWKTDGKPHLIEKLPIGDYTLTEIRTPFGYQVAEVQNFTVENTGEIQVKEPMEDNETYGMLNIVKKDELTGKPLESIVFELRYKNDVEDYEGNVIHEAGEVVETLTTDKDGKASLSKKIPIGTYGPDGWNEYIEYVLVEVKRVDGQYKEFDPVDIEFTYINDKTPIVTVNSNLTNLRPIVKFDKTGLPETFEGDYTVSTRDQITVVKSGDTITYIIDVWNEGAATAYGVLVKDPVPDHVTFDSVDKEIAHGTYKEETNTVYWTIDELKVGQHVFLSFDVTVDEITNQIVDIVNVAFGYVPPRTPDDPDYPGTPDPDDPQLPPGFPPVDDENVPRPDPDDPWYPWTPTDEVVHRTELHPNYTIEKVRVEEAPESDVAEGKYGFSRDDVVTYQITITNTGDCDISSLKVKDKYEEIGKDFFDEITFTDVKGEGVVWLNEETSKGTNKDPELSIEVGSAAVITVSAHITEDAIRYLADTAIDDKKNSIDGYLNTATAYDVTVKFTEELPDPESDDLGDNAKMVIDRVGTKDEYPELADKSDTANTPVEVHSSYEVQKYRVEDAPECVKGGYGFFRGDEVNYVVIVENTGETDLEMTVSDAFESGSEDFFDITYAGLITSYGVVELDSKEAPRISVPEGEAVAVVITVVISDDAAEYLSEQAVDDKEDLLDGYLNTVTVSDVEATMPEYTPDPESEEPAVELTETKYTKEDDPNLDDQEDTANTPVQVRSEYTMSKVRIPEAPKCEKGGYGFYRGDDVHYAVTIENTGETSLRLSLNDVYKEVAEDFFELHYIALTLNGQETIEMDEEECPILSLRPGDKIVVTICAHITDDAIEYLAPTAVDNKESLIDGYLNTATVSNVEADLPVFVPADPEDEESEGTVGHLIITKEDDPMLEDQKDTANTPVQLRTGFKINKVRVEDATSNGAGQYGFVGGSDVTYKITVENFGETKLTMTITDRYEEIGAPYFTFNYTGVEGAEWLNKDTGAAPRIAIEAGETAVITVVAHIAEGTPLYLANTAADDKTNLKDGYLNTVRADNVENEVPTYDPEDEEVTIVIETEKDDPRLAPQEDTANTPVRTDDPPHETPVLGIDVSHLSVQIIIGMIALLMLGAIGTVIGSRVSKKRRGSE